MDSFELLKSWPAMANLSAASILSLPSWKMALDLSGSPASLVCREGNLGDEIVLSIALDDEEFTLGLADSPIYPDLHLVWRQRAALPDAVLLALVEKECGSVFQAIEAATHRLLSVKGLAAPCASEGPRRSLDLSLAGETASFSLSLSPALDVALGQLRYIDLSHETIRGMTRPVFACYAAYPHSDLNAAEFAAGDVLVIPEEAAALWQLDETGSAAVWQLRGKLPAEISFGQIADGALPPVPEPSELVLVGQGRTVAEGTCERCGDASVFRIAAINP